MRNEEFPSLPPVPLKRRGRVGEKSEIRNPKSEIYFVSFSLFGPAANTSGVQPSAKSLKFSI
jgi:hypothetical protein